MKEFTDFANSSVNLCISRLGANLGATPCLCDYVGGFSRDGSESDRHYDLCVASSSMVQAIQPLIEAEALIEADALSERGALASSSQNCSQALHHFGGCVFLRLQPRPFRHARKPTLNCRIPF